MLPGGVYAMIAETPPARFPILAASMAGAVTGNIPTTLLVPSAPKVFIDRLTQVGFPGADAAIETGHLQVFQLQDDFSKKMFRFGAEAFVSELDHFRLPAQSYLVIDQADELLSLHDISLALEQAEALGQWARKLKVTILLVFTRVATVSSSLATLTGLMDYLAGIVRLGGHQDGLDLTFEYWQSPDGTVAAKVYHLAILDNGNYQVRKQIAAAPAAVAAMAPGAPPAEVVEPEESPENLRYLFIDPTLAGLGKQMIGQWQACDSVVSVIRAAFGTVAPTVLLSFERTSVLRDLAEAVHTLRLSLGRRTRIVVIEREASLRYQNEILLLRLGTSLVVHRDVQENRIPLMLESLRGQVFNRDIEMHFDAALSSVVTSAKRGYLPPANFVRETTSVVDRSDLLNLPCALVVAKPDGSKACTELLTRVRVTRAGDLTTTDGKLCYIFFSGCPESSLKRALQAVLGDGLEQLFADMQFVVMRPDIRTRLVGLGQEVQGKTFPDTIVQAIEPKEVVPQLVVHMPAQRVMQEPEIPMQPVPPAPELMQVETKTPAPTPVSAPVPVVPVPVPVPAPVPVPVFVPVQIQTPQPTAVPAPIPVAAPVLVVAETVAIAELQPEPTPVPWGAEPVMVAEPVVQPAPPSQEFGGVRAQSRVMPETVKPLVKPLVKSASGGLLQRMFTKPSAETVRAKEVVETLVVVAPAPVVAPLARPVAAPVAVQSPAVQPSVPADEPHVFGLLTPLPPVIDVVRPLRRAARRTSEFEADQNG